MEKEFNRIFELYNRDIFLLAYSFTLDVYESKDILQETFLKYYKNINSIVGNDIDIKKWLIRVASNISKDYLRSFYRKKIVLNDDFSSFKDDLKSDIEFRDILIKLDKTYRIVVYLYYYEGYKIEEISEILRLSKSAVKMRLSRARNILKDELEKLYG